MTQARRRRLLRPLVLVPVVILLILATTVVVTVGPRPHAYILLSAANEPTLRPGDRVLVRSGHGGIHRGDFVAFRAPQRRDTRIMRVVAVGGDQISGAPGGSVILNGHPDLERYLSAGAVTFNVPDLVVPVGSVFLMGDNRGNSSDSRFYGPVALTDVIGRVVFRYFPLSRLGVV